MAIFEDTRELSRQQRHVGMDKVTGWKKTALAMMGYKDTGEKNWFGKTGIPNSLTTRFLSNQLSKGSDAEKVLKETNDEWAAAELAKLKFAGEVAAVVAGASAAAGAGGAGGSAAAGKAASQSGNAIFSGATPPINATGQGGNVDIASSTSGLNLQKRLDSEETGIAKEGLDISVDNIIGNKSDRELLNSVGKDYMIDSSGNKVYKKNFDDEIVDDLTDEEIKARKKAKRQERLEKTVDLLGNTPLLGSGLDLVAKNRATTLAAEQEADIYKNKVASESQFNLL